MAALVFISYASPDAEAAELLRSDLEADGIPCWIAPRDVPAGTDYAEAIIAGIGASRAVLLLLSPASNASDHVEREAHLAVSQKRPILPVRLQDVRPAGSLEYLLANAQWVDAFPRLAPNLGRVRADLRALLQRSGTPLDRSAVRTPFARVLAGATAWLIVLVLMFLALLLVQRIWFNLVPPSQVPAVAWRRAPLPLLLPALVAAAALAAQYWAHRNVARVASLDALFGIAPGGPRTRSAAAAAIAVALVIAIFLVPPTIAIELEQGPIGHYNTGGEFSHVMAVPFRNYVAQRDSHYLVRTRIGSLNPAGIAVLRLEVTPYATSDGVEFGDLLVDRRLGVTQTEAVPDDTRQTGYVEIRAPVDLFAGRHIIRLSTAHYRDAEPVAASLRASVALEHGARIYATPHSIPASVFSAEELRGRNHRGVPPGARLPRAGPRPDASGLLD